MQIVALPAIYTSNSLFQMIGFVPDNTQLLEYRFVAITTQSIPIDPLRFNHSIISESTLLGQTFFELRNGMSTDSALASEASIIRAELLLHSIILPRISQTFKRLCDSAHEIDQVFPRRVLFINAGHQNRPPRMDRAVNFFSVCARYSRYTPSPSPGSEPPFWMHSMR